MLPHVQYTLMSRCHLVIMSLFFRVVLEDVLPKVVILVALGTIEDGLFHVLVDAVDVVKQALLVLFGGIRTLVDHVDDILDLLATLPDGIIQRLPLAYLPLFGRKLAARHENDQGCQYCDVFR